MFNLTILFRMLLNLFVLSCLYLLGYDTYIALFKYRETNSNALQNHLDLIYKTENL